jgi:hypothetical protein
MNQGYPIDKIYTRNLKFNTGTAAAFTRFQGGSEKIYISLYSIYLLSGYLRNQAHLQQAFNSVLLGAFEVE